MGTFVEAIGTFGEGTTPEGGDAFLVAETTKWGKVIRDAGVTLDGALSGFLPRLHA